MGSLRGNTWKALLLLSIVGVAPASAGTASINDLSLPSITYSHTATTGSGTFTLTASETASDGWHVTLLSGALVYSGAHSGTDIPAANLGVTGVAQPVWVSGQAVDGTGGPTAAAGATGALNVPRTVVQTQSGFGVGTYTQLVDVQLTVPAGARAGTYTAALTVTMATGP